MSIDEYRVTVRHYIHEVIADLVAADVAGTRTDHPSSRARHSEPLSSSDERRRRQTA